MENEGEEDEDEQMQKFFALIRNTKDMHDRLRNVPQGSKEKEEEKKVAVWNPMFQPEDFMEHAKSEHLPLPTQAAGPSSSKKEQQRKEEEDDAKEKAEDEGSGLDLKLSL
ncbi:hypothetical protein SLE2022_064760 [Rubroshorea leprosula]